MSLKMNEIKRVGDALNAVVTYMEPDSEELDREKAIALKDNISTKGVLTTACCPCLKNYRPVFDSWVSKKLKEAGYQLVAKTTMDELAMGGTGLNTNQGPTLNPYDPKRIAGGSSSGSAALVGSGVLDLAIGSDTGDSVRKPAAYCGCVGVKPSYGRISRYGVIPYSSSLDHVGYFTRTVRQAASLLEVLAGRDDQDMTSSFAEVDAYQSITGTLKGKRLAVIDNLIEAKKDDSIKDHFMKLLTRLEEKGVEIVHVRLNDDLLKTCLPVYYLIANCEAVANHANLDGVRFGVRGKGENLDQLMVSSRTQGLGSLVKKRFVIGGYGLDDAHQEELFGKAQKIRRLIVEEYKKALKGVDGVLAMATDHVAPLIDEPKMDDLSHGQILADNHLCLQNFNGYPSITLPAGFDQGLPFGINLTMPPFEERLMFDVALGLEDLLDFESQRKEHLPWTTK